MDKATQKPTDSATGKADAFLRYMRGNLAPAQQTHAAFDASVHDIRHALGLWKEYGRFAMGHQDLNCEDEDEQARQAINELNADLKVIKLYIVRNNVWASVEVFIDPIENFRAVFPRSIRLLANGVNKFREKMTPSD